MNYLTYSNRMLLFFGLVLCLFAGCEQEPATPQDAEAGEMIEEEISEETAAEPAVQLTQAWMLADGLDRPESAIYDGQREVIYISNLVGEGDAMDGVGYIARVGLDGSMIDQNWVSGLNAPKGLTLQNGLLYSTDVNALLEIDPETGEILNRYEVEGDVYLNDVAGHPDGSVYVTDSRYSKIYQLQDGAFSVWMENDDAVQMPNGIHVVGDELWIVAGDAASENPGTARYLKAISMQDKSVRPVRGTDPEGALDAVEPDEKGGIFVTDWAGGRLMYFNEEQGLMLLEQLGQGAADVDYISETGMLYVPVMQDGLLIAYQVQ